MATLVKAYLIGDLDGGQTGVLMTVLIKGINQDGWSIRGNIIDIIFVDLHRRKEATARSVDHVIRNIRDIAMANIKWQRP